MKKVGMVDAFIWDLLNRFDAILVGAGWAILPVQPAILTQRARKLAGGVFARNATFRLLATGTY
jgi:hypothetical protein